MKVHFVVFDFISFRVFFLYLFESTTGSSCHSWSLVADVAYRVLTLTKS